VPGRRLAAIVAGALAAGVLLTACTGGGPAPPTPGTSSPTPSSTGSPDPRCLHEAGFLVLQVTGVQAVLTTLNATDRTFSDLQTAFTAAQGFQDKVQATVVHHPLLGDRLTLIAGIQDIVEGLQAEAAAPNRVQARIAQHQTSKGSGEVNVARANLSEQRARCSA
jgi:hypothetical protein